MIVLLYICPRGSSNTKNYSTNPPLSLPTWYLSQVDWDFCITPTRRPRAMRRPIIAALPPTAAGFISDSAATMPSPSGVTGLARDRLDHPLAAAIRLIYAARPTWPVGYARLRRSREDRPRVQRASPPIEHRAAAASPRRAAAPPPRGSSPGCTDPRHRCVAPSGRSAAARGPPPHRDRPLQDVPVAAPFLAPPLRRPVGP